MDNRRTMASGFSFPSRKIALANKRRNDPVSIRTYLGWHDLVQQPKPFQCFGLTALEQGCFKGIIASMYRRLQSLLVLLILLSVLLSSCQTGQALPTATATLPVTATAPAPTQTTVPMAAIVNGEGIPLTEYQAELQRYQSALGTEMATDQREQVLNDLIDQLLLAQAAKKEGFIVDEKMMDDRIQQLTQQMGGEEALQSWMHQFNYSETDLKNALARQIAAAWMRDQIFSKTPKTAEQVHARQILLYQEDQAKQVLELLKSGKDFAKLAEQYDPLTYGDLGWFPRGFLLDKKLEEVIFALTPGSFSEIVQTQAGYHIVQLIERDPNRALEADTYQAMQLAALQNWLAQQRNESQIEILTH